jgi:uncharacterized protein with HEPN domain
MTDKERLEHIYDAIQKIEVSLSGITKYEFLNNDDKKDASYGRLVMLSEAVARLTAKFKEEHQQIEWHLISGFRNIIVHEYFKVNWHLIWNIIEDDLPKLKLEIELLLNEL